MSGIQLPHLYNERNGRGCRAYYFVQNRYLIEEDFQAACRRIRTGVGNQSLTSAGASHGTGMAEMHGCYPRMNPFSKKQLLN